jgi:hypothetical protein
VADHRHELLPASGGWPGPGIRPVTCPHVRDHASLRRYRVRKPVPQPMSRVRPAGRLATKRSAVSSSASSNASHEVVGQDLHAGTDDEDQQEHIEEVLYAQPRREARRRFGVRRFDGPGVPCDEVLNRRLAAQAFRDGDRDDQQQKPGAQPVFPPGLTGCQPTAEPALAAPHASRATATTPPAITRRLDGARLTGFTARPVLFHASTRRPRRSHERPPGGRARCLPVATRRRRPLVKRERPVTDEGTIRRLPTTTSARRA